MSKTHPHFYQVQRNENDTPTVFEARYHRIGFVSVHVLEEAEPGQRFPIIPVAVFGAPAFVSNQEAQKFQEGAAAAVALVSDVNYKEDAEARVDIARMFIRNWR